MRIIKVISDDLNQLGFITPESEHYYPFASLYDLYNAIRSIYGIDEAYEIEWRNFGPKMYAYVYTKIEFEVRYR